MLVVVGGTIPKDDAALQAAGMAEVLGPGATTGEIVDLLRLTVAV